MNRIGQQALPILALFHANFDPILWPNLAPKCPGIIMMQSHEERNM